MNKNICNTYSNDMQEATPSGSQSDTCDKILPFNGRCVKPSSPLSFDVTNSESYSTRVSAIRRGGRYRGYSKYRELPLIECSYFVLTSNKKATSTINKQDNSSLQSSSGIDKADSHSFTNKYEPSSSQSESNKINNTDNVSHPDLLPVSLSFSRAVGQSKELPNKNQTDESNDNSSNINKTDEHASSIENTESKQNLSRVQIDNSEYQFNLNLPLTECEYSICIDKKADLFKTWLERVKAVNAQSVIIERERCGFEESLLAVELINIKIARFDQVNVIKNLICWTERFQNYDISILTTIFYSLVKAEIFLWPQHIMTYDEITFMKILLSTLDSKYEKKDVFIIHRNISNTLLALANLAKKSSALFTPIDKLVIKLLMLICELARELNYEDLSINLSAIVKLVLNNRSSISIKDQNVINAVTLFLSNVATPDKTFSWLSISSLMYSIGNMMQMDIEDKHCIMNAFNALLPSVKLDLTSVKPRSICNVLFAILHIMREKKDDMKIPDDIDITKDIIEPLLFCVNKDTTHELTVFDASIMIFYISSLRDIGLTKINNIVEPVAILIAVIPILSKEHKFISISNLGIMMLGAGKLINDHLVSIKKVVDSIPPMLEIIHRNVRCFTLIDMNHTLFYLKEMIKNGIPWDIKYERLIYDVIRKAYKNRNKLTIVCSCFMATSISQLLSFGVVRDQADNLIEFLKDTLLPHVLKEKKSVDKLQNVYLVWSLARLGECINVPKSLLLYCTNSCDVGSLSKAMDVSKMLWGLTYFYAQPGLSNELKCVLKKSMNDLFKKLEIFLTNRNDYTEKQLRIYVTTLILAACWLDICVDVDTLTSFYRDSKVIISKAQKFLLLRMRRFFYNEVIESEKGKKGFPPLDIRIEKYKLGVEVNGPVHYIGPLRGERIGGTILKQLTYQKMGYTIIAVPVSYVDDDKKIDELLTIIRQHIVKCKQPRWVGYAQQI
ncbi:MAG: hypothetical protein KAG53_00840 [Endozoicomonadaceae bacterium]|nr:hypothetical protein [Endozoicomonadaceae bacterium]